MRGGGGAGLEEAKQLIARGGAGTCRCWSSRRITSGRVRRGARPLGLHSLTHSRSRARAGVGHALVSWGVSRAEADGVPCYLEASPFGKGLYIKHGFGIVGHMVTPGKYTVPGYAHARRLDDVDGEERWESHMPLMYRPAPGGSVEAGKA